MNNVSKHKKFLIEFLSAISGVVASAWSYVSWKTGMKKRYFFTRGDRLRLRYVVVFAFFVATGFSSSVVVTYHEKTLANYGAQLARVEPLAGYQSANVIGEMIQESLNDNIVVASAPYHQQPVELELHREVEIKSGDALGVVLEKQGISSGDVAKAIKAMEDHLDPRKIKAGQKIVVEFEKDFEENPVFKEMQISIDPLKTLVVSRADMGFDASVDERAVKKIVRAKEAEIEVSLYGSAAKAGIPQSVVAEAIRIYSWNIDFQRDIRAEDTIELMYESYETENGYVAKTGNILYANLVTGGKEIPLYRFETSGGRVDYFMPDGVSIKRTLMKTPIDGARVSSGFGMRHHPVLGYNKMHKGMDFAASKGTPIYAAGDGVVEKAGWNGGYGKYVKIRHNSKLHTAYAHMNKIHSTVKSGQRVTQGQVIGYVGTTGRSTGPHLHYEVLKNGTQVNPNSVDLPTGEELQGNDKKRFEVAINSLRQQFAATLEGTKVASKVRDNPSFN
jgi:murein DD-endopeptidase MepM/ murein hydrolase activator NlpD